MEQWQGGCSCGDVQYQFEGEPMNSVFCYCKECQISSGSDKWFGLWVAPDKFKIIKGSPQSYSRQGDSGQPINYLFCGSCGTTLYADVTVAKFYSVAATTLADDRDLTPKMAIYTASAPSWALFPVGVPKFDILPPSVGG
ncbi:MAG: GFA family protein [Gammaproteobacteria bacterium]|nr:GFA family protein [Gammaproteobacteria bacterium]